AGQMGPGTNPGDTGQLTVINNSTINGTTESAANTYDLQGRLVTSSLTTNGASAQRRFAYDRLGNRTGMWDSVSAGNQLQSITLHQSGGAPTNQIQSVTGNGAGTYTYDAAGNLTGDGVHTYQYDGENRLITVDTGATAAYAYDYHNRRFRKAVGSTVTHYIWEGNHVLAEHNGSTGAQIVDYVYAASRIIGEGPGNLLGGNGTFTSLLSDKLSIRVSLDKNANVLGRQAHLPFGEEFGESGVQEKHHFTHYESDPETGTYYAVNRQYAQSVGRFMRVDPVGGQARNSQSWDRYSYTLGDPVNSTDPTGLFLDCQCGSTNGVCNPCPPGGGGDPSPCPPNQNSAYAVCAGGGGEGGGQTCGECCTLAFDDCKNQLLQDLSFVNPYTDVQSCFQTCAQNVGQGFGFCMLGCLVKKGYIGHQRIKKAVNDFRSCLVNSGRICEDTYMHGCACNF
ncbi:MAG: RHS repeat domain-containing protein, partial [Blastocatellia bacterium]